MIQSKIIIALEGMDGSGKTFFSSLISNELHKLGVVNKCWPIDSLGCISESERNDPDKSYNYYVNSIRARLIEPENQVLIFDRYIPSALGYKDLRKRKKNSKKITNYHLNMAYKKIKKPDLTVVLFTDEDIRKKRVLEKSFIDHYDIESLKKDRVIYWNQFYNHIAGKSTIFLNTNNCKKMIVARIIEHLIPILKNKISNTSIKS
ncbi:hypothetical protein [Pseudoalteromonas distincta]|uniref:hypothetical protein n=1 Tax=Pseudoalteromonas distincta TaxID=77608 RepID=UPI0024203868|nr:hypothetical protein [Pseudoalteromonas distincta]|tara:strand:- start:7276 stop:7890 length:615 start_codon:yes stop_codon:yes gene_type:complete